MMNMPAGWVRTPGAARWSRRCRETDLPADDPRIVLTGVLAEATNLGLSRIQDEEWSQLAQDARDSARALRRSERPEAMAIGVESLKRRQRAVRERLEGACSKQWIQTPWGPKTDPTNIPTNQILILNRIP
jgi:hypothetical protein